MNDSEDKTTTEANNKPPKEHPVRKNFKQSLTVLRNKYALTLVVFVVWLTFFDRYNLVDMKESTSTIRDMKTEKIYYLTRITEDSTRIKELTTNSENLEKYAREQYLMKKADEEIFIVK
jgi:cell division protein DivIC